MGTPAGTAISSEYAKSARPHEREIGWRQSKTASAPSTTRRTGLTMYWSQTMLWTQLNRRTDRLLHFIEAVSNDDIGDAALPADI